MKSSKQLLLNNRPFQWRLALQLGFSILLLTSCSNQPTTTTEAAKPTPTNISKAQASETQALIHKRQYQQAKQALNEGNLEKAERRLKKLTEDAPHYSGPWINLATIKYQNKLYTEAELLAKRARDSNPENQEALNISGLISVELGKFKEAEGFYKEAITKNPNHANAHYNLALLYDVYYQDIKTAALHYKRYLVLTNFADKNTINWLEQLENSIASGG